MRIRITILMFLYVSKLIRKPHIYELLVAIQIKYLEEKRILKLMSCTLPKTHSWSSGFYFFK